MIPLGAIEQSVFRLLNIKKEKQKRNSRGFIRTALQALIANDIIVGARDFDPDSDQLVRSDRPSHFRPTMRAEIWLRDNCENAKDATKTEIITQMLRDFRLIPEEQPNKENTSLQRSLFDNEQFKSEDVSEENFTDETSLVEIRNRSAAAAASPWERTQVPAEETPVAATADAHQVSKVSLPSNLNHLTPRWWEEFKNKCPEYRELAEFMPESVLIDLVRKTAIDYFVRANGVPAHMAANFNLEFKPQFARLADTTTPIEGVVREIFWRAIFYSERIADNGFARKLLLDTYQANAFDEGHALFSSDLQRSAKALSRIACAIDSIARELAPLPPAELSPPMMLDYFPQKSGAEDLPRPCAQIIDWRSIVLRNSSRRKFLKPSRSGFYLTPFGQLVSAILQARSSSNIWNMSRIAAWRTAVRNNRGSVLPKQPEKNAVCWAGAAVQRGGVRTVASAQEERKISTIKEGGLLKNAAKTTPTTPHVNEMAADARRSEESESVLVDIPARTSDGKLVTVRMPSSRLAPINLSFTLQELEAIQKLMTPQVDPNQGTVAANLVGTESTEIAYKAGEFEDIENKPTEPEPPENFVQIKYRLVDLSKSAGLELRKHTALRRHEDVIAFVVPDVVNTLCDRIMALQNTPLGESDENMRAEEVCKVALYHALNTLIRIINGMQHHIRKTEIEEKSIGDLSGERAFKVDFLADYAAQVVLAIEELAAGKSRILPLISTDEELTETSRAANIAEAPSWSLQRNRKIVGVNWRVCDPTTAANH